MIKKYCIKKQQLRSGLCKLYHKCCTNNKSTWFQLIKVLFQPFTPNNHIRCNLHLCGTILVHLKVITKCNRYISSKAECIHKVTPSYQICERQTTNFKDTWVTTQNGLRLTFLICWDIFLIKCAWLSEQSNKHMFYVWTQLSKLF